MLPRRHITESALAMEEWGYVGRDNGASPSTSSDSNSDSGSDVSSSSSGEDIVAAVAALGPIYGLDSELMETRKETRFYDVARMQRTTFVSLLEALETTGGLRSTTGVSSGEKLMILIHVMTATPNRPVSERWQHSGSTVSLAVEEVLNAAMKLQSLFVTPPTAELHSHIRSSAKFYPFFKDCVGAIDGTHIAAVVPEAQSSAFRNRKGVISQNVLAACDFSMHFCYLLCGWEGSVHDGRVLEDGVTRGFPVLEGKYYLGDAGYALNSYTLTPYRGVRYHLREWATGNDKPQNKEELFNLRHASLRNVIERIFGVVKKKFPLLKTMLPYPFAKQVQFVKCAAIFHNFIRLSNEAPGPLDTPDNVTRLFGESVILERNTSASDESEFPDSASMKRTRDKIALEMWCEYMKHIAERDQTVVV